MKIFRLICLAILITGSVFFLDQSTKRWMFAIDRTSFFYFFHGLIQTTQHRNSGIIANVAVPLSIILLIGAGAAILLLWALLYFIKNSRTDHVICAALMLGGAIGNSFDRMVFGYVRDWLLIFHRSVINLADVAIVIGIIGYALRSHVGGNKKSTERQ